MVPSLLLALALSPSPADCDDAIPQKIKASYINGGCLEIALSEKDEILLAVFEIQDGREASVESIDAFAKRIDNVSKRLALSTEEQKEVSREYLSRVKPFCNVAGISSKGKVSAKKLGAVGGKAIAMAAALGSGNQEESLAGGQGQRREIPPTSKKMIATGSLTSGLVIAEPPPSGGSDKNPPLPFECSVFGGCAPKHGAVYHDVSNPIYTTGPRGDTSISDSDINQGPFGDCYFLASLGAVSNKYPETIAKFIHEGKDGLVTAKFFGHKQSRGLERQEFVPSTISVDRTLPQNGEGFVFAKPSGNGTVWSPFAEKAYAKWKGSYDTIGHGGWPGHALEAITGRKSWSRPAPSVPFDKLSEWNSSGKVMVIATKEFEPNPYELPGPLTKLFHREGTIWDDPLYRAGTLSPNHAYWIEKVDKKNRTITLANPWGIDVGRVVLTEKEYQRALVEIIINPVK